jgi:hypothetical protein
MPRRLTDKSEIRRLLNTDRQWSLYALADLDDGMFEHCDWWGHANSLALVFRALEIRPIFVLGDSTADLLRSLSEPSGDLNLKPEQFEAARGIYEFRVRRQMRRMFLETPNLRAGGDRAAERRQLPGNRAAICHRCWRCRRVRTFPGPLRFLSRYPTRRRTGGRSGCACGLNSRGCRSSWQHFRSCGLSRAGTGTDSDFCRGHRSPRSRYSDYRVECGRHKCTCNTCL